MNGDNIHEMTFNTRTEFEKCKEWCTKRNYRGGFAVNILDNVCYFKNLACKNNLVQRANVWTFLKRRGKTYGVAVLNTYSLSKACEVS